MKIARFMLIIVALILPALWMGRGVAQENGAASGPAAGESFVPVDVYVDAGAGHLAAYQIEITAPHAEIVGLEGGETKAFESAPYYDPAALQGNRIVVAAFSTDADLPAGEARVARLHMLAAGSLDAQKHIPEMTAKLVVATDSEGKKLDGVKVELRRMRGAAHDGP